MKHAKPTRHSRERGLQDTGSPFIEWLLPEGILNTYFDRQQDQHAETQIQENTLSEYSMEHA